MFRISTTVPKILTKAQTLKCATRQFKISSVVNCQEASQPSKVKTGLKYLVLASFGGSLAYIYYDNNARKQIEEHVPYAKEVFESISSYLPLPKEKRVPEIKLLPYQEVTPVAVVEEQKTPEVVVVPEKSKKELELEKKKHEKEEAERLLKEREDSEAYKNKKLEEHLHSHLAKVSTTIESALKSAESATEAVRQHTQKLKHALDTPDAKEGEWEAVVGAHNDRSEAVLAFESLSSQAKSELEEIRTMIAEAKKDKVTKKNKALYNAEDKINKLNHSFNSVTKEFSKAKSDAKIFSEYRDLVKKGKEQFKMELESILPEVHLTSSLSKMSDEELNALIAHAHRRIDQLQRQLAEQMVLEKLRLEEALYRQKEEDAAINLVHLGQEKDLWKNEVDHIRSQWDLEARVNFEADLKRQLMRQAAAHSDHITEVLKVQQRELEAKFAVMMSEAVETERREFQKQVVEWVARLRGIEEAIDKRAELEKQSHQIQKLWLACESLQTTVNSGKVGAKDWQSRVKPLDDEIQSIREAAFGQPAILAILDFVPQEAADRGVWTEPALIERFKRVSKVCKQVAMIDESTAEGGSLFKFALSYLQSKFIIAGASKIYETSMEEVEREDLKNTFVLLDNAEACLKRGDFIQAVRYVNQLSGEPRRAAASWLAEARLLMETKQVSSALLASASAAGFTAAAGTS